MANKELDAKTLKEFSKKVGVEFKKTELLKEALTHRSFRNESKEAKFNERLEFIGDAVLELAVTEFLFKKYADYQEGDLTSFRAALVRTESLALEAKKIDLGEFLYLSSGEEGTGGRDREYILANAFEALIGLIYLEKGYEVAKKFIEKRICYKIEDIVTKRLDIDPKSRLQEVAQEKVKMTPSYQLISADGPDHNKVFKMAVYIGENKIATGDGKSKQAAEQEAALGALENWEKFTKKYFKK